MASRTSSPVAAYGCNTAVVVSVTVGLVPAVIRDDMLVILMPSALLQPSSPVSASDEWWELTDTVVSCSAVPADRREFVDVRNDWLDPVSDVVANVVDMGGVGVSGSEGLIMRKRTFSTTCSVVRYAGINRIAISVSSLSTSVRRTNPSSTETARLTNPMSGMRFPPSSHTDTRFPRPIFVPPCTSCTLQMDNPGA